MSREFCVIDRNSAQAQVHRARGLGGTILPLVMPGFCASCSDPIRGWRMLLSFLSADNPRPPILMRLTWRVMSVTTFYLSPSASVP